MRKDDKDNKDDGIGTYESDPGANKRIRRYFAQLKGIDVTKLEQYARIALRRFPELQDRESISPKEIKNRLKELKDAGYCIGSYRGMKKGDLFSYLNRVRGDIREKAKEYCPNVLKKIDASNLEQKLGANYFR